MSAMLTNLERSGCSGMVTGSLLQKYAGIYEAFIGIRLLRLLIMNKIKTGLGSEAAEKMGIKAGAKLSKVLSLTRDDEFMGEFAKLMAEEENSFLKILLKPPGYEALKDGGKLIYTILKVGVKGLRMLPGGLLDGVAGAGKGLASLAENPGGLLKGAKGAAAMATKVGPAVSGALKNAASTASKDAVKGLATKIGEFAGERLSQLGAGIAAGPEGWAADLVLMVITVIQVGGFIGEIITLEFAAPDLFMHEFSDSASACLSMHQSDNLGICTNGYLGKTTDGTTGCKPCPQIENMRDFEDPGQYNRSFNTLSKINSENQNYSYAANAARDPSVVHKLTTLTCPRASPGVSSPQPTYADRPYPGGYCHRINTVVPDSVVGGGFKSISYYDQYNHYLTNDGSMCVGGSKYDHPKTDDIDSSKKTDSSLSVPRDTRDRDMTELISSMEGTSTVEWNWAPLDWAKRKGDDTSDNKLGCDENKWGRCWWNSEGAIGRNWQSFEMDTDDLFDTIGVQKPIHPVDLDIIDRDFSERPIIHEYNNSNVCNDNFEMAGDSMYFRKGNREYDLEYENKEQQQFISNYCCPRITNSKICPKWSHSSPIKWNTKKTEFGGHTDQLSEPNNKNCYIINKPEFISNKMRNENINRKNFNSNTDYKTIRSGSIQCGPKNKDVSNQQYESLQNESYQDHETYTDPENVIRPIKQGNKYYGTRFKIDNRYNFFSDFDSGSTGYENYLDPHDFVPLKNKTGSKFQNTDYITDDHFYISHKDTTIDDVISHELGHDDRSNLYCDNIKCNDLEKTKYTQTVYDEFCKSEIGYSKNMKYNKFYRPAWIRDKPNNIPDSSDPELYSDICCNSIDYSHKTSFVGCDTDGNNSYFIDQIIQDYNENSNENSNPYVPDNSEDNKRNKINPIDRNNLNQCIPSMEAKCTLSNEYYTKSSPSDTRLMEIMEEMEICDNLLDKISLNKDIQNYTSMKEYFSDKNLTELCKENSDGMCTSYVPQAVYDKNIIDKQEYWLLKRKSVGYGPEKGWIDNPPNNWNSGSENNILNQPEHDNTYTQCVEINPCSDVYDLEIYKKSIDIVSSNKNIPDSAIFDPSPDFSNLYKVVCSSPSPRPKYQTIRYIGGNPPDTTELMNDYISINCRNFEDPSGKNFSNIPAAKGPFSIDGDNSNYHYYNIACISSPSNKINIY
jgi:hypothetical protein